ncbi:MULTISPECIES: endolytic transglycosylase MltG [Streptomyces]|uniref:endolytic transglycosylase MltG n=1 Tax=Streptomyces TaxID=1883 RepID=UPI0020964C4E|nr:MULTISPECIES: endolytic transglycosylase MltG [Streptomyces]MCO6697983.1 endolytic transglycosylase MltG [Streptomyces sp. Vc17.3-30]
MTEYGRGQGSDPWQEDPLSSPAYGQAAQGGYGDGWSGQQPGGYPPPQPGYDGQPYQQYPQDGGRQGYPQQQYPQQGHPGHPYDPHQQGHPQQQHPQQQHPQQGQYGSDGYGQQYGGQWDTGQVPPYDPAAGDPYQQQAHGHPGHDGYGDGQHDPYRTEDAYPPPRPPGRREEQRPESEWEEPGEETHPFFTGADDAPEADEGRGARRGRGRKGERDDRDRADDRDGYDDHDDCDDEPEPGGRRGGRGGGKQRGRGTKGKSRNGVACLVVSLVLLGGGGAVAYYGYQFYQDRFGPAEDYAGDGSGQVVVEVPQGAVGWDIANLLKKHDVVKSGSAFVNAQNAHPQGKSLQPGFYTLRKQMSGKAAVELMLSPKSRNTLIIPEGRRNAWVYDQIDKRLGVKAGTTEEVALKESTSLGLPKWANNNEDIKDPLEGFLFPSSYPLAKSMEPADVLKKMVAQAKQEYARYDLEGSAEKLGLKDPLQVVTVASLVQAEGMTHDDFRKMAAVVYNRLQPDNTVTNQKLEFDSTYNYLKGESEIDISIAKIRNDPDPYNTYYHKLLPPGPIGNPGSDAMKAAVDPDTDDWMFFISIDGKTTQFTKTLADHEALVKEFNESRRKDQ